LFYSPLPDELDLTALLERALTAGKTVSLPRLVEATNRYEAAIVRHPSQDCIVGRFQVPEPRADCPVLLLNQLDLILVPGVAFDMAGRRLGRGKGYYDRMLAGVRGIKCGVAFDCQLTADIPEELHDVKLNCLVTPTRWLEFPAASRF
jgi:5-formyltetrahydrofolate cyclo-ligase